MGMAHGFRSNENGEGPMVPRGVRSEGPRVLFMETKVAP